MEVLPWVFGALVTLASGVLGGAETACSSAAACSYNGVCSAGACVCAPQWTGPACATLNRLQASKIAGFRSPHIAGQGNLTSSWGGSILQDETTKAWHMFSAQMVNDCGIGYWEPNSQVVHATAAAAEGPYTFSDVVTAPFAHEPNAVRSPEGDWVIYMTMRHPPGGVANCTPPGAGEPLPPTAAAAAADPSSHGVLLPAPRHTYMTHSKSPGGPWSEPVLVLKANYSIWDNRSVLIDTNLAVTIDSKGAAIGIWRLCENIKGTVCEAACCTFPHLLTASNWKDPATYFPHSERQIFKGIKPFGAEDPDLWTQKDAASGKTIVKAILHDEQGASRETAIGRFAFSDDSGVTWTYAQQDAYNGSVSWTDGSNTQLWRRERPHMVVDANGAPLAISNGVQECGDSGPCPTTNDRSWTLVQPIAQQ